MESNDRHDDAARSAAERDLALLDNASKVVGQQAAWPRINPLVGLLVPLAHLSVAAFIRGTFRWLAALALLSLFGAALYWLRTRLQVRAKPDPKRYFAVSILLNTVTVGSLILWPWGTDVVYAPSGLFVSRAAVAYLVTAVAYVAIFALFYRRRPTVDLT